MSDTQPIISVKNITKNFNSRPVVSDLSFDVARGQIFGLVGPSGCGKTTTIRLMTGIYRPTKGAIRVLGREPIRFGRQDREEIGYLPQHFVLYRELNVTENLGLAAGLYGVVRRRGQLIRDVLEFVELWDDRKTLAGNLSGGMQRRLGLAAALVHDPSLIFVDEPTAGIDPVLRAKFWDHFRELRDSGRTIFLTTQYVTEAEYCDEVAVLREGRLLVLGTPDEIRRQALGGEVLELEADSLNAERLGGLRQGAGVREIRVTSPEQADLVVDDAAAALPQVQKSVEGLGIGIKRLGVRQMSFDEVFVALMKEADSREQNGSAQQTERQGPTEPASKARGDEDA